MGALREWLYGPILDDPEASLQRMAPLTLNIDDVRDMDTKLRQMFNGVQISTFSGTTRQVFDTLDEVLQLPAYDRKTMTFYVRLPREGEPTPYDDNDFDISLSTEAQSAVIVRNPQVQPGVTEAINALTSEARRRIAGKHIRVLALVTTPLAVALIFAWLVWNFHTIESIPLLIILALGVIPVLQQAWRRTNVWHARRVERYNRLRLATKSRREAEEQRYNERRDRRVRWVTGLVIGPLGAALGAIVTVLVT